MATRGVFQLKKLSIYYCEFGGSSRTIRQYIGDGHLIAWATDRPHINIEVIRRGNRHPYVHADYLTSTEKNSHQISVKNFDDVREIEAVLNQLANRSGRKISRITKNVLSDTPSIQGIWTPFLNLQHEEPFDVQFVDIPPVAAAGESIEEASHHTSYSN